MAARTTVIPGKDLVIKAAGSVIPAGVTFSLRYNEALVEVIHRSLTESWVKRNKGTREWGLDFESYLFDTGGGEIAGQDYNLQIDMGGATFEAVIGIIALTLNIELSLDDATNKASALWRELTPNVRSWNFEATGVLYDPAATNNTQLDKLLDNAEAQALSSFKMIGGAGQVQWAGDGRLQAFNPSAPIQGSAGLTFSIGGHGKLTKTVGDLDTVLASIFTAIEANPPTTQAVAFTTDVSTETVWSGNAYPATVSIEAALNQKTMIRGTYEGTGPLTRATV